MSDSSSITFDPTDRTTFRWMVYGLLIVVSAAGMVARIALVESKSGKTPMLSANDRSRWSNIRSLVDHGTYEIDQVVLLPSGKRNPEWYSIDSVKHRGRDGREHFYSSKPTLLTTGMAGAYWLLKQTTGMTLERQPFNTIRWLLVWLNVLPLLICFVLMAWIVERLGTTDSGRVIAMIAATSATYLTTFAVTANNHLPAAICVAATVAVLLQIGIFEKRSLGWFALAGLLSALAAANELPALSFFGLVAAGLFWFSPRLTLLAFVPAAGLVLAGAIGTNYLAHGTWSTPYAHRNDGPVVATIPQSESFPLAAGGILDPLRSSLNKAGLTLSPQAVLAERPDERGWMIWDPETQQRFAVSASLDSALQVREWNNWYEYEGTYWISAKKQGVDRGEPSKLVYAFHALVGHHGVFSLTPLWVVSVIGIGIWLYRGSIANRVLALGTAVLTVVCLTFYIFLRPLADRNYGGVSCCFRWTLWLIPLWIVCLLPAADAVGSRPWLRRGLYVLLFVSAFSAIYNSMNPWSHPWIFDLWSRIGWIKY